MGRVVRYRLLNSGRATVAAWEEAVRLFAATRSWREGEMWLATDVSRGLFESEYLRHLRLETPDPILGAGFVKVEGDETDALAVCFGLIRMTGEHGGRVLIDDLDNPIRKQRRLELIEGTVSGPRTIDELMVAGPIFKRLPRATITFYPPRYRGRTLPGPTPPAGQWGFALQGMRAAAGGFLEAEAEAMRIYRGLQAIG